jgi:hypothetical protein
MRKSGYIKKCIFLVTIAICQSMQDCVTHFLNNTSQRLYQSCYNKLGRFRRNLHVPWTTDDGHQIDNISSHGPSELRLQNNRLMENIKIKAYSMKLHLKNSFTTLV